MADIITPPEWLRGCWVNKSQSTSFFLIDQAGFTYKTASGAEFFTKGLATKHVSLQNSISERLYQRYTLQVNDPSEPAPNNVFLDITFCTLENTELLTVNAYMAFITPFINQEFKKSDTGACPVTNTPSSSKPFFPSD